MSGNLDPSTFDHGVTMEALTSAVGVATADTEAPHVVNDLVNSGGYHMPNGFPPGGYAVFRILPVITHHEGIQVLPLEFGATALAPDISEKFKELTPEIIRGDADKLPIKQALSSHMTKSVIRHIVDGTPGHNADWAREVVSYLSSKMLGGFIQTVGISPRPENGFIGMTTPFWHRSLTQLADVDAFLAGMPNFMRQKVSRLFEQPDSAPKLALAHFFSQAVLLETVSLAECVNLKLPPKRERS